MTRCLFASDIHGQVDRYEKLIRTIESARPDAVFLGGDLLPSPFMALSSGMPLHEDFVNGYLAKRFELLRERLLDAYPKVFLVLGNDDGKFEEAAFLDVASRGLWTYAHDRRVELGAYWVYGYAYVPPTPFRLKDWERYDVSRYVDPGCVSPEEGSRSVPEPDHRIRHATIAADLEELAGKDDLQQAVFLFHSPPYQSNLDRAALDGKSIDHVPLDVHVGSIAIQRFIKRGQPLLTLHGHVHESVRITGSWRDRIGRTHVFGAAHDGPELALVRFDLEDLQSASRDLL
ncbi:MAG: metallophosphoesterase [Planctomycetota bacterium]